MNCKHHPDRESTHVVFPSPLIPVCDECAEVERQNGLSVKRHQGFLFGLPIIVKEDVLDAEFVA